MVVNILKNYFTVIIIIIIIIIIIKKVGNARSGEC